MNITEAINQAVLCAKAGEPVLLIGQPGIGKTAVPNAVAKLLGLPYREIRAAEFESVDFRGVPTVVDGRTVWNLPEFWPSEACVLNFDEISQAPPELTSPLLKIFLGRSLGNYTLPTGTVLFATANDVADRAGCSRISSALRERCVIIRIEADATDWLAWYRSQATTNDDVVAYIEQHRTDLHCWDAKKDFNQPTPRNWERMGRVAARTMNVETLAGIVGPEYAAKFAAFVIANVRIPAVSEVLAGVATDRKSVV